MKKSIVKCGYCGKWFDLDDGNGVIAQTDNDLHNEYFHEECFNEMEITEQNAMDMDRE